MRIKNGFVLREISGEYIAIPFGESYETQAAMISLNSTGAFLWQALEEDCDRGSLCKALAEAYQIAPQTAEEAVDAFLADLRDKQLLIEE